jgi:hypothetical protein
MYYIVLYYTKRDNHQRFTRKNRKELERSYACRNNIELGNLLITIRKQKLCSKVKKRNCRAMSENRSCRGKSEIKKAGKQSLKTETSEQSKRTNLHSNGRKKLRKQKL